MLALLGINKILAIYVGPTGYAALGQFQNAVQMITTFASGAINTGVTKYTAEYHDDELKQQAVWRTAGTITLICSILSGIIIAIFNRQLAIWFLQDSSYGSVFVWFAATLVLFTFNTLFLAILNGKKEIILYVVANIAGSFLTLIVMIIMVIQYNLYGALVSLAIYQSISFFVTFYLCHRAAWFNIYSFFGKIDKKTAINLGKFTIMALTSAICVPLSHIFIRNHLGNTLGWEAAGYWEAMWRFSSAYLMLVTSILSVYYLPRFSELQDRKEIRREIINGYKIIIPIALFGGATIYFLRKYIVELLFSFEFIAIIDLFLWQIIGDFIKILSWLLGYIILSKAFLKIYILSEIIFSLSFVLFIVSMVNHFGIKSTVFSHAINYMLHIIFMFFALKYKDVI